MELSWQTWIERHEGDFESNFERDFVEEILSQVPGLTPSMVACQTWVKDLAGGSRRIDFTISEGKHVRIAIEVDGYNKDGQPGESKSQFFDRSMRDLSLAASVWGVPIHVANGLIDREPETFREGIGLRLKLQRNIEATIDAGGENARRAEAQTEELRELALKAGKGDPAAEAKLVELERRREREYLSNAESERLQALEGVIDRLNEELRRESTRRELAEQEKERAEGEKRAAVSQRNLNVKQGLVFAAVVVLVVALFVVFDSGSELPSKCADATLAKDLTGADEGETVTVKGEVEQATPTPDGVFLNLGGPRGEQDLTVVIWAENVRNWGTPPEAEYNGREIAVFGEVKQYLDGELGPTLQIEADAPKDITICP